MTYVPGRGNAGGNFMVVGEAPGAMERKAGIPFVGPSGKLVDEQVRRLGIEHDVWITNAVKENDNNDTPTSEVIAEWRGVLLDEIDEVSPRSIIALGRVAAEALTSSKDSVGKWIRSEQTFSLPLRTLRDSGQLVAVTVTYHPAFVLRGGVNKASWAESWNKFYDLGRVLNQHGQK